MVASWFQFLIYAISEIVTMVFSLDTGLGFSLGDVDVALLLIGIVATAFVVKTGSALSSEVSAGIREVRSNKEDMHVGGIK